MVMEMKKRGENEGNEEKKKKKKKKKRTTVGKDDVWVFGQPRQCVALALQHEFACGTSSKTTTVEPASTCSW